MKLIEELTDSGFGAGEAAVFRDQVSVVALARKNLEHVGHFLSTALFGASVNSESNICSIASKLPPEGQLTCLKLCCPITMLLFFPLFSH